MIYHITSPYFQQPKGLFYSNWTISSEPQIITQLYLNPTHPFISWTHNRIKFKYLHYHSVCTYTVRPLYSGLEVNSPSSEIDIDRLAGSVLIPLSWSEIHAVSYWGSFSSRRSASTCFHGWSLEEQRFSFRVEGPHVVATRVFSFARTQTSLGNSMWADRVMLAKKY